MIRPSKSKVCSYCSAGFGVTILAIAVVLSVCEMAGAFEIPIENDNINARWDNTIRYNYGVRVKTPEKEILNNPNFDDGDRNFDEGTVTNRLDLLSDFDFRYQNKAGFRVSGAFWYDQRYNDPFGNNSVETSNHLNNGVQSLGLDEKTKDYHRGPYGELLDAFVFGNFQLGPALSQVKAGRHAIFWGESFFTNGYINSVAYGQMPMDWGKAYATPGVEYKEFMRPIENISTQIQMTDTLSLSGQYFLNFEHDRFPEAGSYLSQSDIYLEGGESYLYPGYPPIPHGSDIKPDGTKDWGVALHWTPVWLGGKIGLYYRNFTDKLPQFNLDYDTYEYFFSYKEDIDLYGISFTKEILGASVGLEYSYRQNMPLLNWGTAITAYPELMGVPYADPARPDEGESLGTYGNTHHAVANVYVTCNPTRFYDYADVIVELSYANLDSVESGEKYYMGDPSWTTMDRTTGEALGLQLYYSPTWYNIFGIDGYQLSVPISYYNGLSGKSPVVFGDFNNSGSWTAGLALDIFQKYKVGLNYTDYFGPYDTVDGAVSATSPSGTLRDRDWISLTFKYVF